MTQVSRPRSRRCRDEVLRGAIAEVTERLVATQVAGAGTDRILGLAADLRQLADDLDAAARPAASAPSQDGARRRRPGSSLTPREHEILRRVATGQTNAEIAEGLFLAGNTVKTYWQSALQKLGVRNRAEAIHRAHELHLL